MIRISTTLAGVSLLQLEPRHDERGFFARCFCREELAAIGIEVEIAQANLSQSSARGTLRGLHYQLAPSAEYKFVQCVRGRLFDLVLDLRTGSASFGAHFAVELDERDGQVLVVPPGCAHGFLTLSDETTAFYLVSSAYTPARERGVRWDDPAFALPWPFQPLVISDRDRAHPDFDPAWHLAA